MTGRLEFEVKCWRAWLPPGLRPDPVAAEAGGLLPQTSPEVGFLPLMQRRRLSPMGRAAVAVAWPCLEGDPAIPVVCCSRHGETRHCFAVLSALAEGDEVSPTRFALSVHGAIGGLLTQFTASHAPWLAIAPGSEGYAAALLEAAGFVLPPAEREAKEVLVVWYEQPLPAVYHAYVPDPPGVMALAVRLAAWRGVGRRLAVERVPGKVPDSGDDLLRLIVGFCRSADRWVEAAVNAHWCWDLGHA